MSHSWWTCPDCEDDVPDCDCCISAWPHGERCRPTEAASYRGACEAMSRFLTWVWLEAEVQWGGPWGRGLPGRGPSDLDCEREMWFAEAFKDGRLKLVWP